MPEIQQNLDNFRAEVAVQVSASPTPAPPNPAQLRNRASVADASERLVKARLGVFAGLFYALRAKHPPTAAHSLRVALGCSKWAIASGIDGEDRDIFEIGALLHDVGKIGIPDSVLQKPANLDGQEQLMMEMSGGMGEEMLRGAGASDLLIRVVQQARFPFDSCEDQHPLARMMAIVDAFDSMTTEQVFRRALSRDRAIEELCSHAGEQFDPELVQEFVELLIVPRPELEAEMIQRWLAELTSDISPGFAEFSRPMSSGAVQSFVDTVYHRRLLECLADAAIYLDWDGQILVWNRAAERLSGRRADSLTHCRWSSDLLGLRTEKGQQLNEQTCPIAMAFEQRTQVTAHLESKRPDSQATKVNVTGIPVFSSQREITGLIVLVRDTTAQSHLEERVQTLNTIASQDTLTKVANRAALTERLPLFLQQHLETGRRGSVIMCDIDFFKRINDNFGHQAGDRALVTFANLLKDSGREEDFIARFGGEEFVVLCSDCDNPSATMRAEEMRRAVESTPMPSLDGTRMTSSFGVTEIQEGDTEETLLARADRALLTAKESGRNRIVQLGAGKDEHGPPPRELQRSKASKTNWLAWFRSTQTALITRHYLASVPEAVAIQKLKGFIADHHAEVVAAHEALVTIRIDSQKSQGARRRGERMAQVMLDITVQGVQVCTHGRNKAYQNRTRFSVTASPVKSRDRRTDAIMGQLGQILQSFQSYMVAQEIDEVLKATIIEPR